MSLRIRNFTLGAIVGMVGLGAASNANAGVIFSNFGPGQSYDCCSGYSVANFIPAMQFIAAESSAVSQIDVALFSGSGNPATVSLLTDLSGLPGTLLGQWQTANVGFADAIYTISGITGISVVAGDAYWVQIDPLVGGDTCCAWSLNDQGSIGLTYDPALYGPFSDPSFVYEPQLGMSAAFDVLGADIPAPVPVPEPETWAMLLVGLFGIALLAGRGRREARLAGAL